MNSAAPKSSPSGAHTLTEPQRSSQTESAAPRIDDTIRRALDHYFKTLGDQAPHALYDMVVSATERPLLSYVMGRYDNNVTHAAKALGITRNTLRKKLEFHGLSLETKNPSQSRTSR
jgi:Fis family transcriptional regulator